MSLIDQTDTALRYITIAFYLAAWGYMIILALRARKEQITSKQNYYLSFSFFFLFTAINYILTEINLTLKKQGVDNFFVRILPESFRVDFGFASINPMNSDYYLILFFLLSSTPMLFAIEKFVQQRIPYGAILGLIGIVMAIIIVWVKEYIILAITVTYAFLMLIILSLFIIAMYFKIALKSVGDVRKLGLYMGIGFILMLAGLFATSAPAIPEDFQEITGHIIGFVGILLLTNGLLKLQ